VGATKKEDKFAQKVEAKPRTNLVVPDPIGGISGKESQTRNLLIPKISGGEHLAETQQQQTKKNIDFGGVKKDQANERDSYKRRRKGLSEPKTGDEKKSEERFAALKMMLSLPSATTSMHFRPADKTTYLLGTIGGEILLVSSYRNYGKLDMYL